VFLPVKAMEVLYAADTLRGVTVRTPLLTSAWMDRLLDREVVIKAENLQRTGSFKFRGAFHALASMPRDARTAGVIAASSGNHAQALALAARLHKTRATVVIPDDAPAVKREAITALGARILPYDRRHTDRDQLVQEVAEREGLTVVPSSDHRHVVAGAGTVAWEMLVDVRNLAALVVPVGGGGLAAGSALAARNFGSKMKVFGVEPSTASDTHLSMRAGRLVPLPGPPTTIADGLAHVAPSPLPFEIMRQLLEDVVLVPEAEIAQAMAYLWQHYRITAEPSGAVALAGLLRLRHRLPSGPVGVVVSGGNVDWASFRRNVDHALTRRGSYAPVLH
jgi:threonine dehydratase